jgi:hypothetical protein
MRHKVLFDNLPDGVVFWERKKQAHSSGRRMEIDQVYYDASGNNCLTDRSDWTGEQVYINETDYRRLKMDVKEAYKALQAECGIRVGDTVRIIRTAKRGEMGWAVGFEWNREQKDALGVDLTVISDKGRQGFRLKTGRGEDVWAPFFALELVKHKEPEKMVTIDGKEYSEATVKKMIQAYSK